MKKDVVNLASARQQVVLAALPLVLDKEGYAGLRQRGLTRPNVDSAVDNLLANGQVELSAAGGVVVVVAHGCGEKVA